MKKSSSPKQMKLHRETLRSLVPEAAGRAVAGIETPGCYPPTFAPTCYDGCYTASCPGICN
ncbi:MAG TPA: hypothetical protein VMM92_00645 [Thermoanaerobaculia bacterium]|nr:hypothetical protein [Thermoanaerobaculia bacterium]